MADEDIRDNKPCLWKPFGLHDWEEQCDTHDTRPEHYRCKFCHMDTNEFYDYWENEAETPCPGSAGSGVGIECLLNRIHRGEEV